MANPDTSSDEYIRRIVDAAPPLTEAQKDQIRLLLAPSFDRAKRQATPDAE